ncbi:MAG: ATP-binding protein, partial [Anaerolineaceae bacterium]|nr:ATP-binding protein [Anaerolineaceae bacterium]
AIFAHEVRNPINNISTGIQLLNNRLSEDDRNQEVVSRIHNDCLRLESLMESVLSFSRPLEPKMSELNLVEMLKLTLYRWRPRLERLDIEYDFQEISDTPKISGDPRLLEQVFTNLISNAVDVMEEIGGILAMKISKSNIIPNFPQVEVAISDSGPGIPPELIDRIFEPFVSNKPRGTGLGLAITKHIITAHRGTIDVKSYPGGTVFYVRLPALSRDFQ